MKVPRFNPKMSKFETKVFTPGAFVNNALDNMISTANMGTTIV